MTPTEYDLLLGKFILMGKALEVMQASVQDGIRTLNTMRPSELEREVPPGTPAPPAPTRTRVTKTFSGEREKVLSPDEVAEQATAPARGYINSDDKVVDSAPPPRASGSRRTKQS